VCSKRFRGVWEQRKTEEWFCLRKKWVESQKNERGGMGKGKEGRKEKILFFGLSLLLNNTNACYAG